MSVLTHQHDPAPEPSDAARPGLEAHERLARALTGVLGSFAASAAVAARIQSTERAQAFRQVAEGFDERRKAMQQYTEMLERKEVSYDPVVAAVSDGRTHALRGSEERARSSGASVVSVTIPGLKRDVGLGDAVSKLTGLFGLVTCSGCARRAEKLNRALVFRASPER